MELLEYSGSIHILGTSKDAWKLIYRRLHSRLNADYEELGSAAMGSCENVGFPLDPGMAANVSWYPKS